MTTNLIESTSSAPTLAEMAIAEWQRSVDEQDAQEQRRRTVEFSRKLDVIVMYLRDKIGTTTETADIEPTSNGPVLTVDGLRFTLRDLPYADHCRDRERLHVSVPCSRGCGKELWVNVESMDQLGGVLQPDATNTHSFNCLQQFDDFGEPITDRNGNPLPPSIEGLIRNETPAEKARDSVAWIESAAERCAHAHRIVQELEDRRASIKAAAIMRLMLTENPLTKKPHSASSAEAVVETDAEYFAHRQEQASAEVERWRSLAAYSSSKLMAWLNIALVETNMRDVS